MLELYAAVAGLLLGAFVTGWLLAFCIRRAWRRPERIIVLDQLFEAAVGDAEPAEAAPEAVVAVQNAANSNLALPRGIPVPRLGQADDLRRISGIGPRVERALNALGTYHYEQISRWNAQEAEAVSLHLGFPGRVAREQWVSQARVLARAEGIAAERPRSRVARRRVG